MLSGKLMMKKSKLQSHAGSQKSQAPCFSTPIKRRFFSHISFTASVIGAPYITPKYILYLSVNCQSKTGRKKVTIERITHLHKYLNGFANATANFDVQHWPHFKHLHIQVPTAVHNTCVLRLHAFQPIDRLFMIIHQRVKSM